MGFSTRVCIGHIELFQIATRAGVSPQMAIGTMPVRPALLLRITDHDGCYGWGEVWANFPPRAHLHKTHVIDDVVRPVLNGMEFVEPREVQLCLRKKLSTYFLHVGQEHVFEHILAGIDVAVWDLALRKHSQSAFEYFDISDDSAPCYASSINADDIEQVIPKAAEQGQRHFKVKIGFQPDNGATLVEHACNLCPAEGRIMIDSNQSWTVEQAIQSLQDLQQYPLYFAEEPLAANAPLADWERLAHSTSIPLAGGENIYGVERFLAMANAGLTVLQPDVAKWGGLTGALALKEQLPDGVLLWPHFMGTAVGQVASLVIAAVAGGNSVCEMDVNKNPLRTDLCGDVLTIRNGCVLLSKANGLVVGPLQEQLDGFAVAADVYRAC